MHGENKVALVKLGEKGLTQERNRGNARDQEDQGGGNHQSGSFKRGQENCFVARFQLSHCETLLLLVGLHGFMFNQEKRAENRSERDRDDQGGKE